MQSTLKRTKNTVPRLYENIVGSVVVLVNKINSDGTMRGMVVYSKVTKYKIGDYFADLSNLNPYYGEVIISND